MIRRIVDWWHERQRNIDLEILWPSCKEQASDLEDAKVAFAMHALNDSAWTCLGHEELVRRLKALT